MDAATSRVPPPRPPALFRLWVAGYRDWHPMSWSDRPPLATAIEPLSEATYNAESAQLFLQGFNSQMLLSERGLWAVAVPVTLRFEGDLRPGDEICHSECDVAGAVNLDRSRTDRPAIEREPP